MDTRQTHMLASGATADGTYGPVTLEGGQYQMMLEGTSIGGGTLVLKGRRAGSSRSFVPFTDGSFNASNFPNIDFVIEVGAGTEVEAVLTGASSPNFDLSLVPVPSEGEWKWR